MDLLITFHQQKILSFPNCSLKSNLLIHYAPYLGIFVFPNKKDIYVWDSFIMIKEGFYEDSIFRFILRFSEDFPRDLPELRFQTRIYHPLIAEDGLLDLNTLFPDWKLEIGRQLLDILTKVRTIFSDKQFFEMENSYNPQAAVLFKENPDSFLEKTLACAKQSKKDFFNLPADCPYRFDKIEKIPEDVRQILEDSKMNKGDKKKLLKDIIENKVKRIQQF